MLLTIVISYVNNEHTDFLVNYYWVGTVFKSCLTVTAITMQSLESKEKIEHEQIESYLLGHGFLH